MPVLSAINKSVLINLKNSYEQLPWYGKLFFPGALATELNKMDGSNPCMQSAFHVYRSYANHAWFFHRWLFRSLQEFSGSPLTRSLQTAGLLTGESAQANFDAVAGHQNPHGVAEALGILQTAGLLMGESAQVNFHVVAGHQDPEGLAHTFERVQTAGLLTGESAQANFNAMAGHQNPEGIASALEPLHRAGLLIGESAQANFDAVAGHQDPHGVASALEPLHRAGLLIGESAQANFDAVAGHQDPEGVSSALKFLQDASLLSGEFAQANFDAVAGHQDPEGVSSALKFLQDAGLLTGESAQANRDAVAGHQDPDGVASALKLLQDGGLLTGESAQDNRDVVAGHQNLYWVARVLELIQAAGLLSEESAQANFAAVVGHQDPEGVAHALDTLQTVGLLTRESAQANFDAVVGHQHPGRVASALKLLQDGGLLTGASAQDNRDALVGHQDPYWVARVLELIQIAGLLTGAGAQVNRDAVAGNQNPYEVARALETLQNSGLLIEESAQANFDAVVGHQDPKWVVSVLEFLQTAGLLTGASAQANRDAVIGHHQDSYGVARVLKLLQTAGLLTGESAQDNRGAVAGHQNPYGVARALAPLQTAGLLTGESAQANFAALVGHQHPGRVATVLEILQRAGLIVARNELVARNEQSQTRFDKLISYSNILCSTETHMLWDRIPTHALTEARWNRIIQICRANQVNPTIGRVHFTNYVNREMLAGRLHINPNQPQAFNAGQSTHTASVHQTVSESAIRLNTRYGNSIGDLRTKLKEIEVWVNEQEGNEVEKRAFQQLAHSPYEFVEPTSTITTKMLMALSWTAIHDDSMRMGPLDDGKALFLQGFFDIQRAYNLSDAFEDRGGQDQAACASGTFNKFIEKLVGVHPDAELKYITKQGAMRKLMPLVREAATCYVEQESCEALTVALLKEAIRPMVREQLFFEYGQAFDALTKDYNDFKDFQASGDYASFQASLQGQQDTGLELMVEGKLLVVDEELDEELMRLITSAVEVKKVADEASDKPATQEEIRARRLAFFDSQERQDSTAQHASTDIYTKNS